METEKRNGILVLSGVLFLLGVLFRLHLGIYCEPGSGLTIPESLVTILAEALLCVGLFLGKKSRLLWGGLLLLVLRPVIILAGAILMEQGFGVDVFRFGLTISFLGLELLQVAVPLLLLLLLRRKNSENLKKYWMWPGWIMGIGLCLISLLNIIEGTVPDGGRSSLCVVYVLQAYGYLLIGCAYGHPELGLRGMLDRYGNEKHAESFRDFYLLGVMYTLMMMVVLMALFLVAILSAGGSGMGVMMSGGWYGFSLIGIGVPWALGPFLIGLFLMPMAKANTDRVNHTINQVAAAGGDAHAQAELVREAGKQAQKEIIKDAIVGGIIAGGAGAVVGAASAKAKQDAMAGMSANTEMDRQARAAAGRQAQKQVIKSGVVGGVIAGEAGAAVGAVSARAKQNASKNQKNHH